MKKCPCYDCSQARAFGLHIDTCSGVGSRRIDDSKHPPSWIPIEHLDTSYPFMDIQVVVGPKGYTARVGSSALSTDDEFRILEWIQGRIREIRE